MIYYVLEDGKVVETEDPSVLEAAMVTGRNKVGDTQISERIRVSTQLMGIDLNVPGMIFHIWAFPRSYSRPVFSAGITVCKSSDIRPWRRLRRATKTSVRRSANVSRQNYRATRYHPSIVAPG
jgi:hypothetical protein